MGEPFLTFTTKDGIPLKTVPDGLDSTWPWSPCGCLDCVMLKDRKTCKVEEVLGKDHPALTNPLDYGCAHKKYIWVIDQPSLIHRLGIRLLHIITL